MMPSLLLNFTIGAAVSCVGTLPLGVLNLTIMRVTLRQGIRAAFYFALACALVELFYSYASVTLTHTLSKWPELALGSQVVSLVVLLGIGVFYLIKKGTASASSRPTISPFWLGVGLSIVNVVAIPFWVVYTTLLEKGGYVGTQGIIPSLIYIVGISFGTLIGLLLFVALTQYWGTILTRYQRKMDQWIGMLFIGLALLQAVQIVA
jgi:threonine/homoserine/homoserine lactone efflux protein